MFQEKGKSSTSLGWREVFFQLFFFLAYIEGYLFNFATAATKKISESVAETAQTIKKSVEEGKIDSIIDKVFYFSILDLKYLLAYCCVVYLACNRISLSWL